LPEPAAGWAASQSITTAPQGTEVGWEGTKTITRRKRHLLIDTLGLSVAVVVTAANIEDRQGLVARLQRYFASSVQRLQKMWVNGGYDAQWLRDGVGGRQQPPKMDRQVVTRTCKGFTVLPQRGKWSGRWRGSCMTIARVGRMSG
jgi:putative transposase